MTPTEIRAFLAIVKTGSISKAAHSLYVTQPALSRSLKALEEELGYALILRQRGIRSIELTEAGKSFVELAEKMLALWGEMQDLCSKKGNPVFRISSLDSIGTYLFPPVYQGFLEVSPRTPLEIITLDSYLAYDQMEAGILDLAFTMDQRFSDKVLTLPAFSESMALVYSSNYPQVGDAHPLDLIPQHEIYVAWSLEYEKWHRHWFSETIHPYITIERMTHLEYFLQNTMGWAIVPYSVAMALNKKSAISICKLAVDPPARLVSYLSIPGNKQELTRLFINCLREYTRDMASFGIEILF